MFLFKKFFFIPLFLWRSFSLAQRKEAKETSTYPHPLPIWRGSTAPTRRSFIKVSSPHQRGGLLFFGLRQVIGDPFPFIFRLFPFLPL